MPTISFYQQVRDDGGVRTGIEVNDTTYFELFEIETEELDPALTWYVDIRCEGDALPSSPEAARHWLIDRANLIVEGLEQLAEKVRVGLDVDAYPLHWPMPNAPEGVRITMVCSAARRVTGREFGHFITKIGRRWRSLLNSLPEAHAYS